MMIAQAGMLIIMASLLIMLVILGVITVDMLIMCGEHCRTADKHQHNVDACVRGNWHDHDHDSGRYVCHYGGTVNKYGACAIMVSMLITLVTVIVM